MTTNEEKLQRAKDLALRVTVITDKHTYTNARVVDLDTSNLTLHLGTREMRHVHTGHIVSVTIH